MAAFLALDLGTEGARAAVYGVDGTLMGSGADSYPTRFPRPGWAEQDPDDWWRAGAHAVRQALAEAGGPEIDGVAVATTASTVAVLDRDGRPLRPALL